MEKIFATQALTRFVLSIIALQHINATPHWDLTAFEDLEAQPSYGYAFPPHQYYAPHSRSEGANHGYYPTPDDCHPHHHPPYPYPHFGYHHPPPPLPPSPHWNPFNTNSQKSRGFFKPSVPFFPNEQASKAYDPNKYEDPRTAESGIEVDSLSTTEPVSTTAANEAQSSSTEPTPSSSSSTQDPIFNIDIRFKSN